MNPLHSLKLFSRFTSSRPRISTSKSFSLFMWVTVYGNGTIFEEICAVQGQKIWIDLSLSYPGLDQARPACVELDKITAE